jgi:hypothetical protein
MHIDCHSAIVVAVRAVVIEFQRLLCARRLRCVYRHAELRADSRRDSDCGALRKLLRASFRPGRQQ